MWSLLTSVILVSALQGSQSQVIRGCKANADCIGLARCPALFRKAHSADPAEKALVRKSFCGFESGRLLVCCPKVTAEPEPKSTPKPNSNGAALLPKSCGNPSTEDRIHGGEQAPLGAYPWVVALGYEVRGETDYGCGASMISTRYVLTAAHCVNPADTEGKPLSAVNIGDWDLSNASTDCQDTDIGPICARGPRIIAGFEEIIIHPDYSKRFRFSDDIALIRLDRDIDFGASGVEPICLPPANLDVTVSGIDRLPIAAGWGFTEHRNTSNILLSVTLPFADEQLCRKHYKELYADKQICAGGIKGKDSCSGDSGGPLVMPGPHGPPFLQIGIVSIGPRACGQKNFPGVYTSVADYKDWIVQNLRP